MNRPYRVSTFLTEFLMVGACAIAFIALPSAAQTALPVNIAQALKRSGVDPSGVGAFVQEVGAARPLLAHNASVPMNPASVMKLVTTYAALELLGPAYTWRTELFARPPVGDVIEGDLYLRGSGDPKLTIENFWLMLRQLRARGIREIRGDLVLDRSAFEAAEIDPGKFDAEPLKPYNVGPDPLLVNFKSVRLQFMPDVERGAVNVLPEPRLPQIELVNELRVAPGPCGFWRGKMKADIRSDANGARVTLTGTMPAACGEQSWYLGMLSHQAYVYGTFKSLWEEMGGTIRGGWRESNVPADSRLLASFTSPPLTEIVRDINKFSNNVMTRQLYLTLSADITKLPGRADRSFRAIQSWSKEKGFDLPELVMENGSGLSRIERISAGGMGRMLLAAYASAVMPEFISSMPLVAEDGTMRWRLRNASVAGQAHIKTGGLNDVRTIAGYVRDRAGRRFAVAFFINHPNAEGALAAQDAFLRWVYAEAGAR
jgi:serine-type D-Ala-D-Ala carboxypeptidase/endopeptidase (penicillin-binding protein 4)